MTLTSASIPSPEASDPRPRPGGTAVVRGVVERRSADPVDALSREFDALCTRAVDALEIAAGLEAEGFNDAAIAATYGYPTVFDLAEELFGRVPRRNWSMPPEAGEGPTLRALARGGLFALPGLFYLVAARSGAGTAATLGLVVAMVVGWGWGQGMSVVAYSYYGQQEEPAGRRALRVGLTAGVSVVVLFAVVAVGGFDQAVVLVPLVAAESSYVLSATILLFVEQDGELALALLPGTLVCGVYLVGNPLGLDLWIPMTAAALSVGLTLAFALLATRSPAVQPAKGGGPEPVPGDGVAHLAHALPFAGYGVTVAAFLSFGCLAQMYRASGQASGLDVSVLPVVLSMGPAEWQLRSYRAAIRAALQATTNVEAFRSSSTSALIGAVWSYGATLAALTAGIVGLTVLASAARPETVQWSIAYLLLGVALFADSLLISSFRIGVALACSVPVMAVFGVGLLTVARGWSLGGLAWGYVGICGVLVLTCVTGSAVALADPVTHR
jgi:hypothetical protein